MRWTSLLRTTERREAVNERVKLLQGDCLDLMKQIPDGSVDMICTDPPYAVLNKGNKNAQWDIEIPMGPLWAQFLRVSKENAAIVLFGQGMYTAKLMMSQPKLWKYNLVWCKGTRVTGFLNANRMPLRNHEDICVFYRKQPTYNPQMEKRPQGDVVHSRGKLENPITNNCYGKRVEFQSTQREDRFPRSVLTFLPPHKGFHHPTEKPVDLCRWLIRTYTNPGEVVLDCAMGSGTTGVAAVLESRRFIGVEKEQKYHAIAERRIAETLSTPQQEELGI